MKKETAWAYERLDGPLGKMLLVASEEGLAAALWNCEPTAFHPKPDGQLEYRPRHLVLVAAKKQLTEYFAGKRSEFELPLAPRGTEFQLKAWEALRRIPYGQTISYQRQAESVGGASYARAVGSANRANPIPIIIPCHRVIGKSGSLTGFAYGTDAKAFLLDLEKAAATRAPRPSRTG